MRPIDKSVLYDGAKVKLELRRYEAPDGGVFKREVVVHPGAVVVLPFLDDETILLVSNVRHAIDQNLLELPAGTLEKGEPPMNCAGRELEEETGYLAGRLRGLCSFYTSPGVLSEKIHAFAAFDLEKTRQNLDAGEELEVRPTAFAEAIEMCRDGGISDGKTIATLLWWERFGGAAGVSSR